MRSNTLETSTTALSFPEQRKVGYLRACVRLFPTSQVGRGLYLFDKALVVIPLIPPIILGFFAAIVLDEEAGYFDLVGGLRGPFWLLSRGPIAIYKLLSAIQKEANKVE